MSRTMTNRLILGILGLLVAAPLATQAASLKIWADQFKPTRLPYSGVSLTQFVGQTPGEFDFSNGSLSDVSKSWAPVNLPVGTVIKKIIYYHGGSEHGNLAACFFFRIQMGDIPDQLALALSNSAQPTPLLLSAMSLSAATIQPGFRYYIQVNQAEDTSFRGVKIFY